MLTDGQTEKLARRVGDLLANDAQFAAALPDKNVCETILRPDASWAGLMRAVVEGYADRPALGQRATEVVTTGGRRCLDVMARFDTVTYGQLWKRVTAITAALADGVRAGR